MAANVESRIGRNVAYPDLISANREREPNWPVYSSKVALSKLVNNLCVQPPARSANELIRCADVTKTFFHWSPSALVLATADRLIVATSTAKGAIR